MQQWWKIKGEEPEPINPNDTDHGLVAMTVLAGFGGFAGMATVEKYLLPSLTKFQYDCVAGAIATLFYFGYEIFYGRKVLGGNVFKRLICYCIMGFGLGFTATNFGLRGREIMPYDNSVPQRGFCGTAMFIFAALVGVFYWEIFSSKNVKEANENE